MKRLLPVSAVVAFCLILPATAPSQTLPANPAEPLIASDLKPPEPVVSFIPDDPSIPVQMLDIMRISQLHYQEGSDLLKSGQSAKARAAFNVAVDTILKADWDLQTTPVLNRYFQDLIRRIQKDESLYLRPNEEAEEEPEAAVVDELESLDLIPINVEPSLRDVVQADLANTRYDIPVTLNETVLKSLNYWLNKGQKYFRDGLMRSGRYKEMIQKTFKEASIPPDVMYLAQVESLFKTNALSRKQAKGMWQFGKGTAIRYGLRVDRHIDERSDPEKSTRAAARYLNDLFGMFKDWNLVLAAYNWGEGRVQRLVERSGLNDFWDMMDLRRNFPKETQNHVPLIMASIILAKNPERYGFPTQLDPPLVYDRVHIPRPIDLRSAAKALEIPLPKLKELNPELRGHYTPFSYPGYHLKVPDGLGPYLERKLSSLPTAKPEPAKPSFAARHRVRPGETLARIASLYRTTVSALLKANGLKSTVSLRAGMWLNVPVHKQLSSQTLAQPKRSHTPRVQQASASR
jgi:membrane-bound lytic murein transglycosylase D